MQVESKVQKVEVEDDEEKGGEDGPEADEKESGPGEAEEKKELEPEPGTEAKAEAEPAGEAVVLHLSGNRFIREDSFKLL